MISKPSILGFLMTSFLVGCSTSKDVTGAYLRSFKKLSGGAKFEFTQQPNKFQYERRSEMGLLDYSAGNWTGQGDQLSLFGYNDTNFRVIDLQSEIKTNSVEGIDKILINFITDTTADYFIKTDLVVNDKIIIPIFRDTVLASSIKIKTVQVKSYQSNHGFLLSSPPHIDTLYSRKIVLDETSPVTKALVLKFAVYPHDFVRTKLTDSLVVKNNSTLILKDNLVFKKQK